MFRCQVGRSSLTTWSASSSQFDTDLLGVYPSHLPITVAICKLLSCSLDQDHLTFTFILVLHGYDLPIPYHRIWFISSKGQIKYLPLRLVRLWAGILRKVYSSLEVSSSWTLFNPLHASIRLSPSHWYLNLKFESIICLVLEFYQHSSGIKLWGYSRLTINSSAFCKCLTVFRWQ